MRVYRAEDVDDNPAGFLEPLKLTILALCMRLGSVRFCPYLNISTTYLPYLSHNAYLTPSLSHQSNQNFLAMTSDFFTLSAYFTYSTNPPSKETSPAYLPTYTLLPQLTSLIREAFSTLHALSEERAWCVVRLRYILNF